MKWKWLVVILPIVIVGIVLAGVFVNAAANTQTISIDVESSKFKANPGVYYYQLDNGNFEVELSGTTYTVANGGTNLNLVPEKSAFRQNI